MTKKEAIAILEDIKVKIDIPKAAETQRKRNEALEMAEIEEERYRRLEKEIER